MRFSAASSCSTRQECIDHLPLQSVGLRPIRNAHASSIKALANFFCAERSGGVRSEHVLTYTAKYRRFVKKRQ